MKNQRRAIIIISAVSVLALLTIIKLRSSRKREKYSPEEFKKMMQAKLKDAMIKTTKKPDDAMIKTTKKA